MMKRKNLQQLSLIHIEIQEYLENKALNEKKSFIQWIQY